MTSDVSNWDAIDSALARLYPNVRPKHFATVVKWALGGPDPLDGISFYPRVEPVPHWHIVSYGMSGPDGGWGYEFTFRVTREVADEEPPVWAANFLQNLARYNFSSGNGFAPDHQMDLNGPIALDHPTLLRAVVFAEDPELGIVETSSGPIGFLQVVGITLGEYAAAEVWSVEAFLDLAARHLPLLVTDLDRLSLLDLPSVAEEVEEGRRRDGSSTDSLAVSEFAWTTDGDGFRLVLGAHAVERIASTLVGRLRFGRTLRLDGPDSSAVFSSGSFFVGTGDEEGLLRVSLTDEALDALAGVLVPLAGASDVPGAPGLIVEVRPTQIRDAHGNVVQTIG